MLTGFIETEGRDSEELEEWATSKDSPTEEDINVECENVADQDNSLQPDTEEGLEGRSNEGHEQEDNQISSVEGEIEERGDQETDRTDHQSDQIDEFENEEGENRQRTRLDEQEELFFAHNDNYCSLKTKGNPLDVRVSWEKKRFSACDQCGRRFKKEEVRDEHQKCYDQMVYKCFCGFMYTKSINLRAHFQNIHKMFKSKVDLEKYRIRESQTRTESKKRRQRKARGLQCEHCGRHFRKQEKRDAHVKQHDKMRLKCPDCGWLYLHRNEFQSHCCQVHKRIFGKEEVYFRINWEPARRDRSAVRRRAFSRRCDLCDCRSTTKHGELRDVTHKCATDESAEARNNSAVHDLHLGTSKEMQPHKTERKKRSRAQCHLCGRKFNEAHERDKHILQHDQLRFKCGVCGGLFKVRQ